MGALALDGLTLLVTRPEDRAQKLRALLEAQGAEVVVAPTIEVRPEPLDGAGEFAAAWRDRATFDWLVVVSPTMAKLVLRLVDRDGTDSLPPVAAVGPGTTQGLRGGGVGVQYRPDEATGVALAAGLTARLGGGARVLWPRADIGRTDGIDALRGSGATVVSPIAYHTAPLKPATEAIDGSDLVLFASPSAVEGYLLGESEKTRLLPAIAIGPTTAEAVTAAGLPLAGVADPHTAEGLVQAVCEWAARR
jgi:uroporphyrinogen III methyltransferase/synthase